MAKKLSPWCKEAKKKMIDMDLEVNELASSLGLTRPYVLRSLMAGYTAQLP